MKTRYIRLCAIVLFCTSAFNGPTIVLATENVVVTETVTPAVESSLSTDGTTDILSDNTATVTPELPAPSEAQIPSTEAPSVVPSLLSDHVKYMVGFTDGTMQPNKVLSRAEAVALIYRLLASPESGNVAVSFSDVHDSDWFLPLYVGLLV